jgi:hypothetical protein
MMLARRSLSARRGTTLALVVASVLALGGVAFALPPFTTAPKSSAGNGPQAQLFGVATGCRANFDRFVIRGRLATPGYDARYVRVVRQDGSGRPVRLRGTKRIRVLVRDARAHGAGGMSLIPSVRTPLCPNLRQVKLAGDFEGLVTFGLGLRQKTGFRVFRLTNPTRIVIDVEH